MRNNLLVYGMGLALLPFILSSCGNTREITYMQGKFDTAKLSEIKVIEPVIQKGDLLSIIVYSDNPAATALYNQSLIIVSSSGSGNPSSQSSGGGSGGGSGSSAGAVSAGSPTTPGYLVDERGNIEFQGVGLLHVEGLTKGQLKDTLDTKLKEYLKNSKEQNENDKNNNQNKQGAASNSNSVKNEKKNIKK